MSPTHRADPTTPNSCGVQSVPSLWTWHHRILVQLHQHLCSAAPRSVHPRPNPPADIRPALDAKLLERLATEREPLFEVECALQRICDGVYGFCEETGRPIPAERLLERPWLRYCSHVVAPREDAWI